MVARFFGFSTQHQQCHRRYPRLKPWHSKQFKLCFTTFGDCPLIHGQACGTPPLGLLEEKTSPSLLASRKVQLKDVRQGWIKFPFSSDLYLKLQMRGHPLLSLDILSNIRSAANTRLSSRWFYFRKWYNQPGPVKCSFNSATISCMTLSIPLDLQVLIIDHIRQKHVTPPGGTMQY